MAILLLFFAGILILGLISAVTAGRRNRRSAGRGHHAGYFGTDANYLPPDAGSSHHHHHGGHHGVGHHDGGGASWGGDGGSFGGGGDGGGGGN
ncbi:hypothetical protein [Actinoplanes sp. L3-i22]|uniref:hypothetical protein n=1 Tax=Actinoplanes sp. L3-i22 TaxID=2836373 RepID=UPI001C746AFA|nr:hypothetical protein [Actinoplanes sp. L3-i22]BCY05019.1 hypothetical protein L3i22_001070 [Actinoplanes sp. L3-i22]